MSIKMPRPIMMNPTFTQFATSPMERIERYAATGSEFTVEEQQERRRRWDEARAFQESDVYKRARDAMSGENAPEAVATAVSALCEALYERSANATDETLEIGYWTDKLTIALVKLKRFDEALRWIGRFEAAPKTIKGRTAGGVLEALRKRRARCVGGLKH